MREESTDTGRRIFDAFLDLYRLQTLGKAAFALDRVLTGHLHYSGAGDDRMTLPLDPDSVEMGQWVDRWLHELRLQGANNRTLQRRAQQLGRAAAQGRASGETMRAFATFVDKYKRNRHGWVLACIHCASR